CMEGSVSDLIRVTEALHEKKIAAIADQIASRKSVRLILIAGPSASGKTTFAKRLSIHLKIHGIEPVEVSLDHYYRGRDEVPRHPDGSLDFECLEAINVPLINDHLTKLLAGEEVTKPAYSYQTGTPNPAKSKRLKLEPHQVLIIEGIHGLNDAIGTTIAAARTFKIYVSALTQLCIDSHNRIFTTDTRLCRRIVRDRLFRGSVAAETLTLWPSVRAGEDKYIFPYQEGADVIFNSALIYEHALLKPYAERFLTEVPRDHPSFMEAARLARFFGYFIPILSDEVPQTSILREFIGGSAFQYK
ncbi:MAG: nucleoside kinase, partial [Deltaproteobacteria bacterium]|nr:nucleoside kinase [Deltaproteobacteria bacterium]